MLKLHNGIEIPRIGYGTFPLREELVNCLNVVWSKGYRMIDTSEDYFNMKYIGEWVNNHSFPEELFIVTKISWPQEIFDLEKTIEEYRDELRINRPIDCILLHFPSPHIYIDMWNELERIYEKGLCRSIGVCNFEIKHLEKLIKHCRIIPMINQIELHPTFQQKELCDYCKRNDILIMAYSPLARMSEDIENNAALLQLSKKYNKSIQQIILRWDIQKGFIPLPASKNEKHIASNIDIFDFDLTESELTTIDSFECGNRIRYTADTFYNKKQRMQFLKIRYKYKLAKLKKDKQTQNS